MNLLLIIFGKLFSQLSKALNLGNGSTWPGHIALSLNPHFVRDLLKNSPTKVILVAGTNGKTTTASLICTILKKSGATVIQNSSGANLLNGLASFLLLNASLSGKMQQDYAVFEVDENSLPKAVEETRPAVIVLLNLFRDQLDRYGEVNTIASKWHAAMQHLSKETKLVLNADDPQIALLGENTGSSVYFGLNDPKAATTTAQHAADSLYCPACGHKLVYKATYYSHIGIWHCSSCKRKRPSVDIDKAPFYPLSGLYNRYNTLAAVLTAKTNNVSDEVIEQSLTSFTPAFGRQEIVEVDGKKVQLFLSKNPTSMNQSLRTVKELGGKHILLVLNDRIPDGRDVSWIWDVDFEDVVDEHREISAAGDRAYDMSLRLKYAHPKIKKVDTYSPSLENGIASALGKVPHGQTLFILPTYSAMLDVRKIITGKKIV